MAFDGLLITEIFHSLQGETSLTGVPFAFVRLTGCNLRCVYCDTAYAFKGGTKMSIAEILQKIAPYSVQHVLLTGGEPLMQRNTPQLVDALSAAGYKVSIETHGEAPIDSVAGKARIVLDIKTPGSAMQRGGYIHNLPLLHAGDEVKFVLACEEDYAFSRDLVLSGKIPVGIEVLFSAAQPHVSAPGQYPGVPLKWLAEKILADRLPVRLQIQLHKLIWGAETMGV